MPALPIHHTFAPMADNRFIQRSLGLLVRPWLWRRGLSIEQLRTHLDGKFDAKTCLFSSGRESLLALFRTLNIQPGEEIIVQSFTCVVVPNAVMAAGAVPVFAEIEKNTLSMDPADVKKRLTSKTRAVICQHTFGIPAPLEELRRICDEHHLPLIEDCAHVIPDETGPGGIGMTGDVVMLSFGRDKAVSGVTGGAILSRDAEVSSRLREEEKKASDLGLWTIKRYLLYPLIYAIARPVYGIGLGKAFLKICSMLGLLVPIVEPGEKAGRQSPTLHRLPNACADLALSQLARLKEINDHRRMLTRFYLEAYAAHGWPVLHGIRSDLPLQKFPMFLAGAEKIRRALKTKNIHLHDGWTGCVICPEAVDASICGYKDGDDPKAEEVAEHIFNLPTHPTMTIKQAKALIRELRIMNKEL